MRNRFLVILLLFTVKCLCQIEFEEKEPIYYEVFGDFIGAGYSKLNHLGNNFISFYDEYQQHIINPVEKTYTRIGSKGAGPGEFLQSIPFTKINNNYYSIDSVKMTLMIFDICFELISEKKLNFKPIDLKQYGENKIVILSSPTQEHILHFFDTDGNFISSSLSARKIPGDYENLMELLFIYNSASLEIVDHNIYIMLGVIPYYLKATENQEEPEILSYRKQLSFTPGRPVNKNNNGNMLTAGLYMATVFGRKDNKFLIKASNRKSLSDKKSEYYLFELNYETGEIKALSNKLGSLEDINLIYFNSKLFCFDDEGEVLEVYGGG